MNWLSMFEASVCTRLCLTLLHSVWQTALAALAVWTVDAVWRRLSVERRYALHVAALLLAVAAMPATYLLLEPVELSRTSRSPIAAAITSSATIAAPSTQVLAEAPTPVAADPLDDDAPLPATEPLFDAAPDDSPQPRSLTVAAIARWTTLAPWLTALYLLGVAAMLARLGAATVGAHRLVSRAEPIVGGPLVELLRNRARQWSMKGAPALARTQQIVTPKVVGLLRPTILLPASAAIGLSPAELEMILAHELAHVRRYDLWVNLAQRLAEAVLFYHPAIWLLSRRISALREYCCDELSCQAANQTAAASRVHYAMALLRVVELAHPQNAGIEELTALAADGRSPSEIRRRVARLFGEPVREPLHLTRGGMALLLVLGTLVIFGPTVWPSRADAPQDQASNADKPASDAPSQKPPREFHLTVLGPDDQPVKQAEIEIRTRPPVAAEQITRGTVVRQARYGTMARTDDVGRMSLSLPSEPKSFVVMISKPGFGPYWAEWDSAAHPQTRPAEFTARLDAAWSVGGVVVDEAGQPIEGVSVSPSIQLKMRPGDTSEVYSGKTMVTKPDGAWRYDHVPADKADVRLSLDHPDYAPLRLSVPRDGFGIGLQEKPVRRIEMKRGITVTGRVTDDAGAPIAGALVRTKFSNDIREAKTDDQGQYQLQGCEPRMARVVVSAKGRATDMQEVRIDPDMPPVNFSMQPGGKIRIHVVDAEGKGIPKARIFFQRWRGPIDYFEFNHVDQYADEHGVWEWNEAPLDEFEADICRPDGMQLPREKLIARSEEYIFQPPEALVVSGRVVDAVTKELVRKFRVTPGLRNPDPGIRMNWIPREAYDATDGTYRLRFTHSYPGHLVRIEADGYLVAISRDIQSDEGTVTVNFELRRAADIAATILQPDGAPAAGAEIALGVAGSQISIRNGRFDGGTYATRLTAGEDGRFSIPARDEPFQLVILHAAGFAHLKSSEGPIPDRIGLTPWARIEGTYRIGPQPAPGIRLWLNTSGIHAYGRDVPHITSHYTVTTGQQGSFLFERVTAGQGYVGREITRTVDDGAIEIASSVMSYVDFAAGETVHLDLGGHGRAVEGRLQPPPETTGQVVWSFADVELTPNLKQPAIAKAPADVRDDAERLQAWWNAWNKSAEGKAWRTAYEAYEQRRRQLPRISCSVGRDGRFRIDDVPPGDYVLSVRSDRQPTPGVIDGYRVSVPAPNEGEVEEAIDLGSLQLRQP
jgi:beta-lactamase regulating signal transducer with metallopeptidase domain